MTASKVQWQWSFLLVEWLCIQQQQPVIRTNSINIISLRSKQQQDVSVRECGVAQPAESLRNYLLQVCAALFISGVISRIPPEPHLNLALAGPASLLTLLCLKLSILLALGNIICQDQQIIYFCGLIQARMKKLTSLEDLIIKKSNNFN